MSQQAETEPDTAGLDAGAELSITGMTCASCAARIEKKLNKLPGVEAAVNYATETAYVRFDPARHDNADLVATIEGLGYGVTAPALPAPSSAGPTVDGAPVGEVPLSPAETMAAVPARSRGLFAAFAADFTGTQEDFDADEDDR